MKFVVLSRLVVIFTIIPSVVLLIKPGTIVIPTIVCSYPLLFIFLRYYNNLFKFNFNSKTIIKIFILYNIIICLRGFIDALTYQDWTTLLSSGMATFIFLPLCIFLGADKRIVRNLFKVYIIFCSVLFVFLFTEKGNYILQIISPAICFLILFSPYLTHRTTLVIYIIAIILFFFDLTNRTNMLNISAAIIMSLTYYMKRYLSKPTLMNLRRVLFFLPVILVILGTYGVFNIFKISDYIGDYTVNAENGSTQNLVVDSRTGIYLDVYTQLKKDQRMLLGLGGVGKTETSLTDLTYKDFADIYKEGRRHTESGMLNYVQWGGVLGALIYYLLFIFSSYWAISDSNNWFLVMLGLWLVYKCLFSFIEDVIGFNINSVFLFTIMGVCLNKNFREMTDNDILIFLRSIFSRRYGIFYNV